MIVAIIADDLSGAAELAGVAERGLSAEVQTVFNPASDADVIAVDTQTRAMPAGEAARVVAETARQITLARPRLIYKKTDSVLRGNVRAEIEAILGAASLRRALLIPANPGKARVIRDGVYFVENTPLADTAFAHDPVHPRRSSRVLELLGECGLLPVSRIKPAEDLPPNGIAVPDAQDVGDLATWGRRVDRETLPAGGVEFFQAVLDTHHFHTQSPPAMPRGNGATLFVCGSLQAWNNGRLHQCGNAGITVLAFPDHLYRADLFEPQKQVREWTEGLIEAVERTGCAMAAIGQCGESVSTTAPPAILVERLARGVATVLRSGSVGRVFIEGGETAAALLREMNWARLTAFPSPGFPGVAVLRPIAVGVAKMPTLLVKPGSYLWPPGIWRLVNPDICQP